MASAEHAEPVAPVAPVEPVADPADSAMEEDVASSEAFIGRIYRISAPGCDRVYVGSTRKTLSARLGAHQRNMRAWERGAVSYVTSFELVGRPGVTIDPIEEEEYQDIQHMRDREAYWIARLPSVNQRTPGRSRVETQRISRAVLVPCGTCGKIVRRGCIDKHQRSRACMLAAFNRRVTAPES
jgi:hypothetical protein